MLLLWILMAVTKHSLRAAECAWRPMCIVIFNLHNTPMRQDSLLPLYSSGETEFPALSHDSSLVGHEADQWSWWNSMKSSHYDGGDNARVLSRCITRWVHSAWAGVYWWGPFPLWEQGQHKSYLCWTRADAWVCYVWRVIILTPN